MKRLKTRAFHVLAASGLALGLLAGCQNTVSFNVLRAAKVNVPGIAGEGRDATVSLGKWNGVDQNASADIAQRIREIVTNAPGGKVKFAEADGIVRIQGELQEYKYEERVSERADQCTRTNSATKKSESYACTHYTRQGTARIRAAMNVLDVNGKTVGSDAFSTTIPMSTTSTDEQPAAIDWETILTELRSQSANQLAGLVVPRPEVVSKRWFKCGDANDLCSAGQVQLKQSNFEQADALFKQAIEKLKTSKEPEATAAAWWALTLTHEFSGDYAGASASLSEAIRLAPANETYAAEFKSIDHERKNAVALQKQGVGVE